MVPERVLVLCSANRCRSPLAAALLRRELAGRPWSVSVSSAGVSPFAGSRLPVPPDGKMVARRFGIDLSGHVSSLVSPAALETADLVLGMDRGHVREAVVIEPTCWARAFTLKELVRRGAHLGPRPAGASLRSWLEAVGASRSREDLAGWSDDDDIGDPFGRGPRAWESLVDELSTLVGGLAELAWPGQVGLGEGERAGGASEGSAELLGGLTWW